MSDKAYLVLENGVVFEGSSFGADAEACGELVFTTSMTGYLETLTDKNYYGQIVIQTFPLIGNYGIIPADFEGSAIAVRGYIIKSWCQVPSNFRSEGDLDTFLKESKTTGLCGVDTRALTKLIREEGVMKGVITKNPSFSVDLIKNHRLENAVKGVSSPEKRIINPDGRYNVALPDCGCKKSLLDKLVALDCRITLFPFNVSADEILALNPDGIILAEGPGNPEDNHEIIKNLKELIKREIPIFGIGLGHQLIALANGFKTEKLKYGHRGSNQPSKDSESGGTYITSQNHGYVVASESIDKSIAREWFVNVNDNTCEGILYNNNRIFSVQFSPDTHVSSCGTSFLFDKFINAMEVKRNAIG